MLLSLDDKYLDGCLIIFFVRWRLRRPHVVASIVHALRDATMRLFVTYDDDAD
jgi:hypothetical protein